MTRSNIIDSLIHSMPLDKVVGIADHHTYSMSCFDAKMLTFSVMGSTNLDVWYSEHCGVILVFIGKIEDIVKKIVAI